MPPVKKTNRGKHPRSHMGPLSPIEDSVIDQEELKKRTNQLEVIRRTLLQTTTEEKQKEYIGRAIKIAFGFNGKKEQIEPLAASISETGYHLGGSDVFREKLNFSNTAASC